MTISSKNYYAAIEKVDRSKLQADLKATADFVDEVTGNGNNWELYNQDQDIRETVDLFFEKLGEYLEEHPIKSTVHQKPVKSAIHKPEAESVKEDKSEKGKSKRESVKPHMKVVSRSGEPVERISEELRFIKRFTLLNGKVKTSDQIRSFLNSLQRAMAEKRIRKTSSFAKQILEIQDSLIDLVNSFKRKGSVEVTIESSRLAALQNLCGKQELMLSVRFIKSYIGMQGKVIANNKAKNLFNRVARAINVMRITNKDPYYPVITDMLNTLESFVRKNPSEGILTIPTRELNGLNGLDSLDAADLDFVEPNRRMMNSMDFIELEFDKIGLTGKWLDFIGNPSPGFSILVSAPPKFGKSILCTEFAGYLARNHGKVLYVAKEEGLDDTLKAKLKSVAHPNLIVSDYLPDNMEDFDFVFLDSITRLRLSPYELNQLKENHPNISFIFVSQVTKAGKARGSNEFAHDVDSIIEFPERGRALQYGRFNQGGEMQVFDFSNN
ncbi:hypothetical protein D3C87_22820 [compost metagenome]